MKLAHVVASAAVLAGVVFGVQATGGYSNANLGAPNFAKPETTGSAMSKAERVYLVRMIAYKWSGYVREVRNVDPVVWARSMGPSFAAADPANLRRAAGMQTYEGMIGALLGRQTTDDQVVDKLAKNSSPASLAALASPATGLVYNAVTPCRIVDTRKPVVGRFIKQTVKSFEASRPGGDFVSQGGSATDCGIPADPAAVVMSVAIVQPTGGGYLTIWPYGEPQPNAASANNVPGSDVNNTVLAKLTVGDANDFSVFSFAAADVVMDVVGYFTARSAAAIECVTANGTESQVDSGSTFELSATCPVGYSVAGGGMRTPGGNPGLTLSESYPQGGTAWKISGTNTSYASETVQARANCCRVPGL